jgi:hypothetical protein
MGSQIAVSKSSEGGPVSSRRKKGILTGLIFLVWGIVGAFFVYQQDVNSLDFIRIMNATTYAILHAVLWGVAGASLIIWYSVGPGSEDKRDQIGPPEEQ